MAAHNWLEELERLARQAENSYWGFLGCKLVHAGEDEVIVALDIKPHHLNLLGILHGGVHAALLDSAMGLAAMTARRNANLVTSAMHIHYTAPVTAQRVTATAKVLHQSGRTVTTEGRLWSGEAGSGADDGVLCAITTASYRVAAP
ncbi:PaaI family thioesterase [Paenibacillus sp. GCM10027626]|uniref:PaaI family thioesterase n=1 Tax=Paenibacillus sp. GCM10027626 TaxID=3273411 RepID=UPI00363674E3